MPLITKEYKFCAAHQYWNDDWTEEKNLSVFGDDVKNHGHNYILRITIKGKTNSDSGFLIDLQGLNKLVNEKVINILDHSQIDKDIDWFKGKTPSTENLVVFIWERIESFFLDKSCDLYKIFLRETPTIYTEYYGPSDER
tara:strand:- start:117 stop:536 length:420 start_codon:yes stop_codon:yes gene_type:complete